MSFANDVGRNAWKWGKTGLIIGAVVGGLVATVVMAPVVIATYATLGMGAVAAGALVVGIAGAVFGFKGLIAGGLLGAIVGGIGNVIDKFRGSREQSACVVPSKLCARTPAPSMEPDLCSTKYQDAEIARRQQPQTELTHG